MTEHATADDTLRLLVVIINYKQPDMTLQCLETLRPQIAGRADRRVVVVDNDSGDGSVERLADEIEKRGWGDWVDLAPSSVNGGFSYGNNVGMKHAEAEAYLLLNNDAFVQPGAIDAMLEGLDRRPDAGIISPRLRLPDGELHVSCYRFQTPIWAFMHAASTGVIHRLLRRYDVLLPHPDEPSEPQWTSFACVLVRGAIVKQIGYMDEGYFMYFEDQDYCRRAWRAGRAVVNWPASVVVHHRGGSGPVRQTLRMRARPPHYYYAARSRYFGKYYGRAGLWLTNMLWCVGRVISKLKELVKGGASTHICKAEWRDNWTHAWNPAPRATEGDGR